LDYTLFGWELITGNQKKLMISSETPYKLAEIIRDTWPGIYRPLKPIRSKETKNK
jgi:hypothetical protein